MQMSIPIECVCEHQDATPDSFTAALKHKATTTTHRESNKRLPHSCGQARLGF